MTNMSMDLNTDYWTIAYLREHYPLDKHGGCSWSIEQDGSPSLAVYDGNSMGSAWVNKDGRFTCTQGDVLMSDITQLARALMEFQRVQAKREMVRLHAFLETGPTRDRTTT